MEPVSAQPPVTPPQQATEPAPLQPLSPVPTKNSSHTKGIVLGIGLFIVLVIVGIVLMKTSSQQHTTTPVVAQSNTQTTQNQVSPTLTPQTNTNVANALPPGNSDAQLDQNLQSVDATLGTADTNLGNADQGLHDQETNLTE